MLDDEVQVLEVGRRVVDVMNIECILVQGDDGRPLVNVDVLDAELVAQLEALIGVGIVELPSLGLSLPLGGVEFDALDVELFLHEVDIFERQLAVARVERPVEDEPVRIGLRHRGVLLDRVEPALVEVLQISRLKDRHVVGSVDEQVVIHFVGVVFAELLKRPQLLLGAQRRVIGVEAFDELLAVNVALIVRAAVPHVGVAVDDEDLFAGAGLVHESLPLCSLAAAALDVCGGGGVTSTLAAVPCRPAARFAYSQYSNMSSMRPNKVMVLSSTFTIRP